MLSNAKHLLANECPASPEVWEEWQARQQEAAMKALEEGSKEEHASEQEDHAGIAGGPVPAGNNACSGDRVDKEQGTKSGSSLQDGMPVVGDAGTGIHTSAGTCLFPLSKNTQLECPQTYYERLSVGQHALRLARLRTEPDACLKEWLGLLEKRTDATNKRYSSISQVCIDSPN
jgi:hypothetical protein